MVMRKAIILIFMIQVDSRLATMTTPTMVMTKAKGTTPAAVLTMTEKYE